MIQPLMENAIDPNGDTDVMLYVMVSLAGLCLELMALNKVFGWSVHWMQKKFSLSKAQRIAGILWGGIFCFIGLAVILPVFGAFGWFWTLLAGIFTGLNLYQACLDLRKIRKKSAGRHLPPSSPPGGRQQLEQLEILKAAGLMTDQEYQQKKQEILKGL